MIIGLEEKMSTTVKTIGVLTSGGDAPGMNAAVRSVVITALKKGFTVKGIRRGYAGLLEEDIIDLDAASVKTISGHGGTFLRTARCDEFMDPVYQKKGAEICRKHGIDGVVVIGGDGSFRGAQKLADNGINTIGVPGTIDNDISSTEYTIGFDTVVNTVIECIDKIRDTAGSHRRAMVIEVMGRHAGYIAAMAAIATGVQDVLLPETYDGDEEKIYARVREGWDKKDCHLIINAEGIGDSAGLAKRIQAATGVETRASVLGYVQRGGVPSARDRFISAMMGNYAVDLLEKGASNRVVVYASGALDDFDIDDALAMRKSIPEYWLKLIGELVH